MKKSTFTIFFLLMLPVAFAEISIRQNMNDYNLGDKISVSVSVMVDKDIINAFFRADLECSGYTSGLFSKTTSLVKNEREIIPGDDFVATKNTIGTCVIKSVLRDGEGNIIDTKYTGEFEVKNELNINCEAAEAMPGKEIEISCTARKLSLELIDSGTAKLNYRKKDYTTDIKNGMFSFIIFIQKDTPAGMQKMAVEAEDSDGNYGDLIFEANVKAIPSRLEIRVNKESFKPSETIEIRPVLYDHIDDLINATMGLEFIGVDGEKVISKEVTSGETVSYTFGCSALPGEYSIRSYSQGLEEEKGVIIESLSKLEMTYSNEKVLVKNIGNVKYDDKTTIVLENDEGEKYLIEKRLSLEPGETEEIDLSREVPYDYYNIVLPGESVNADEAEGNVTELVEIHDNRPIYKRGLGIMTGAVVGTVRFISAKPLFTSIILTVMILVIVLFYSRDFIKSQVGKVKVDKKEGFHIERGEDREDLEGLFQDFKYGKK